LVLDEADRLLLVRGDPASDGIQRWWLPGGGLSFGEDPEAAVIRELLEETGLHGQVDGLAGTFSTVYPTSPERPGDPVHVVGIVYRIRVTDGALRAEVDGSTDRCAWVGFDEAASLPLSPGADLGVRLAWPRRG
jgi:ADP-ribose pyrophosphatase YjhB (NUDIX family)